MVRCPRVYPPASPCMPMPFWRPDSRTDELGVHGGFLRMPGMARRRLLACRLPTSPSCLAYPLSNVTEKGSFSQEGAGGRIAGVKTPLAFCVATQAFPDFRFSQSARTRKGRPDCLMLSRVLRGRHPCRSRRRAGMRGLKALRLPLPGSRIRKASSSASGGQRPVWCSIGFVPISETGGLRRSFNPRINMTRMHRCVSGVPHGSGRAADERQTAVMAAHDASRRAGGECRARDAA